MIPALAGLATSALTAGAGAAATYGVNQLFNGIFGGGTQQATTPAADYLSLYSGVSQATQIANAAALAAGNVPVTLAAQGAGVAQGAAAGALGLEAQTQATTQGSIFQQAKTQADTATTQQASEALGLTSSGIELQKQLAQSKLAAEAAGITSLSKTNEQTLASQDAMVRSLAQTNLATRALEQQTASDLTKIKAQVEGALAKQRFGLAAALGGRAAFA